jgi:hypothetical protein
VGHHGCRRSRRRRDRGADVHGRRELAGAEDVHGPGVRHLHGPVTRRDEGLEHRLYGGAAVYIGGKNRGCAQPNLTASWVKSVSAAGWKLIPLYVGAQPPCQTSRNPERFTASTAASLGASNAKDPVAKATALGVKPGSPIYLNMESYDITNKECNDATLTYVRSFTKTLRAKTYRAGYYGFSSSSAKAIATAKDRTDLPGNLWYGLWNNKNSTTADWPWDPKLYTNHSRAHQYMVNSKETRGGHTITVDRNAWDAPVALIG